MNIEYFKLNWFLQTSNTSERYKARQVLSERGSLQKGEKKSKHLRSIKRGYSDKEKEKEQFDSYLAGAYWGFYISQNILI